MPVNRNALIRYKTIDKCLGNRFRRWTLEDLVEACSEALYEYEGIDKGVSRRTVQLDLQMMRSEKLGYNAPIEVYERKYYRYSEPDYSITQIPLGEQDLLKLEETIQILREFKDFSLFQELGGILQRLEDKIMSEKRKSRSIIHLDKNEQLKGLEYLDQLYNGILKQEVLDISYQSFKAREASIIHLHPFLLKEYNNRWFLLGRNHIRKNMMILALDRMSSVRPNDKVEYMAEDFDADEYFKDVVGVSVGEKTRAVKVVIKIDQHNTPYVLTKPLHHSQQVLEHNEEGAVVAIKVQLNFELERLILGFGESMEVISPMNLRKRIYSKLKSAAERYEDTSDKPTA